MNNIVEGFKTKLWLEEYGLIQSSKQSSSPRYQHRTHKFKPKTRSHIDNILKKHNITWLQLFTTAWALLLSRFSTSDSATIGIANIANSDPRKLKEINDIFSVELCNISDKSLEKLLEHTSRSLKKKNKVAQDTAYLILKKSKIINEKNICQLDINKNPMLVTINEDNPAEIALYYSDHKFTTESALSIIEHFDLILEQFDSKNTADVSKMPFTIAKEKKKLIKQYSQTQYHFKTKKIEKNFTEQFEEIAVKHPGNIAITDENEKITYKELNELSDKLASKLIASGVGENDNICILMDRTPSLIMAMLATFKAGATFVPINHKYPPDKIQHVLSDVNAKLILVNDIHRIENKYHDRVIELSDEWEKNTSNIINNKIQLPRYSPENNAYIIFTSGTTGKPKGVIIKHKSIINLIYWYSACFNVDENDRSAQFASQGFDTFICETIPYLASGGSIHIVDDHTKLSPPEFFQWLAANNITICDLPTAYAKMLFFLTWPNNIELRLLKVGGETISNYPKQEFSFDIWNGYGPTETTVESTYYQIYKANTKIKTHHDHHKPPIGKPIIGAKAYIVDKNLNLAPIGVAGELLIGGECISAGYLNSEDLTAKKFIPNPFDADDNNKLYKTGDLARWHHDGNLEYLGRIDHQVKIHGYRIELDEVRESLNKYSDVGEVVVIAKENINHEKSLIAYVEPNLDKNRFLYQERCLISLGPNKYLEAISEDISKDGIAIAGVSETFRTGQKLNILIKLPGTSDTKLLSGHLIWQHENRTGIQFDLNSEDRKILSDSIDYYISTHNVMELILSSSAKRNLKKALKKQLPDYMIPPVFVNLLKFPLTYSGKIDIHSLPPPQEYEKIFHHQNVQPANETEKTLLNIWQHVLKKESISMTDNFFDIGGNSLSLAELSIKMLEKLNLSIPIKVLFSLPYIPLLAKYIDSKNQKYASSVITDEIKRDGKLHEDIIPHKTSFKKNYKINNILLTGAGGFLGIYLLRELVKNPDIKIFCLVRPGKLETAAKKLASTIKKFKLENDLSLENRNIIAISGDLSLENFGLPQKQYESLASKTDLILHCGAQVNTMASYNKLRSSNVHGTEEIIKFAIKNRNIPIHYISTLSSAVRTNRQNEFEEKFPTRKCDELYTGYAVTKWVSERLLTQLKHRGIPVIIYRLGYISGQSDTGITNTNDALFMLIKGCIQMGYAPIMHEKITILPVDYVSQLINKISLTYPLKSDVFHIDHPSGILWQDLVSWLNDYGFKINLIPMKEWQKMLLEIPHDNAIFPLLPYYLSLPDDYKSIDVNITKSSKMAAALNMPYPEINDALLSNYFDYLCAIDFLPKPVDKKADKDVKV